MINKVFKEIWEMGAIKCYECGQVRVHCANGLCGKCYDKNRAHAKKLEGKKNEM